MCVCVRERERERERENMHGYIHEWVHTYICISVSHRNEAHYLKERIEVNECHDSHLLDLRTRKLRLRFRLRHRLRLRLRLRSR